jgi:lipoprotein-releasing system ATP-binding protein
MNKGLILEACDLQKSYHDGQMNIDVLQGVNFAVKPAARIAIVGPSGSGKSTLLHLLGGLDKPSAGKVFQDGLDWQSLSEKQRCQRRNQQLGFVYQFHHLLPEFTALENVMMPLLLAGKAKTLAAEEAKAILEQVGLVERLLHKPSQLSGGERQRVAIARAMVHRPKCVLADEPTGNLDHDTAHHIFEMMLNLNKNHQTALVIVTHDHQLAARMQQVLCLKRGVLSASP